MQLSAFLLCEHAATYGGRLCVTGVFDQVKAGSFPFQQRRMFLVIHLVVTAVDRGEHLIEAILVNDDGVPVLDPHPRENIKVGNFADGVIYHPLTRLFALDGIPFERPGQYRFDLLLDGSLKASAPLSVLQAGAARR